MENASVGMMLGVFMSCSSGLHDGVSFGREGVVAGCGRWSRRLGYLGGGRMGLVDGASLRLRRDGVLAPEAQILRLMLRIGKATCAISQEQIWTR